MKKVLDSFAKKSDLNLFSINIEVHLCFYNSFLATILKQTLHI